ncbi:2870_t:CDS:2 [Diversispora eburnea]|uniref:2870_t:CDS:1 n=1 Tax=Diversispora eburnea TaxID=1213867 RepID=A0A9N9GCC6_9GLOM|nr:2870_t:CDS:2 [Diversispora eburnea]
MNQNPKNSNIRSYLRSLPTQGQAEWYWAEFSKLKKSNPNTFNMCVDFWKNVLKETSRQGWLGENIICLDTSVQLEEKFQTNGYHPMSLPCVFNELYINAELLPFEEFMTLQNQSWIKWAISKLILNPIQKIINSKISSTKWIIMDLLKEAADGVILHQEKNAIHKITDNLFTMKMLKAEFASVVFPGVILSDDDLKVLITYLEFKQKILVKNEENNIIKFKTKNPLDKENFEITSTDRGITAIRETCQKLHQQIQDLEFRIKEISTKINEYIVRKQKVSAKYCLRQKKNLEQVLSKRLGSLEVVEEILLKIQGAACDSEIIDIYNVGTNALRSIFESAGLTADSVEETIDRLQDVLADQKEIDNAIKLGADSLSDKTIDTDNELEKELEELLADENITKEFQKLQLEFSKIPQLSGNNKDEERELENNKGEKRELENNKGEERELENEEKDLENEEKDLENNKSKERNLENNKNKENNLENNKNKEREQVPMAVC